MACPVPLIGTCLRHWHREREHDRHAPCLQETGCDDTSSALNFLSSASFATDLRVWPVNHDYNHVWNGNWNPRTTRRWLVAGFAGTRYEQEGYEYSYEYEYDNPE